MTHNPEANITMHGGDVGELIPRTLDAILVTITDDGTYIVMDPSTGFSVSRRTREEAEAEVRRQKAAVAA